MALIRIETQDGRLRLTWVRSTAGRYVRWNIRQTWWR